MLNWHTARPRETAPQVGWLGRAVDQAADSGLTDTPGIFVGPIRPPFAIQTEASRSPRPPKSGAVDAPCWPSRSHAFRSKGAHEVRARECNAGSFAAGFFASDDCGCRCDFRAGRKGALRKPRSGIPAVSLAQTLRSIAQLIRADTGVRIYFAELGGGGIGGFDTHAGQILNHGALLRELSESVAAFIQDLKQDKLAEGVLLMTFSEFGRTVEENGRRGTGHGAAAPVFIAGGALKGGLVGAHPSLTDLDADAPKIPHRFPAGLCDHA